MSAILQRLYLLILIVEVVTKFFDAAHQLLVLFLLAIHVIDHSPHQLRIVRLILS